MHLPAELILPATSAYIALSVHCITVILRNIITIWLYRDKTLHVAGQWKFYSVGLHLYLTWIRNESVPKRFEPSNYRGPWLSSTFWVEIWHMELGFENIFNLIEVRLIEAYSCLLPLLNVVVVFRLVVQCRPICSCTNLHVSTHT
jgi:hypothetical protein